MGESKREGGKQRAGHPPKDASRSLLSGVRNRGGSKRGPTQIVRDRKGTPKNLCDKDFAELSGEVSAAICLNTLVFFCMVPSNCSEHSLVLFVRFFGFRVLFWPPRETQMSAKLLKERRRA